MLELPRQPAAGGIYLQYLDESYERKPMGARMKFASAVAVTAVAMLAAAPADAKCRRMGFTVNDYGKDGPTADAKALLDKNVAEWAASQGIKKFTIGKKDVKCELFLDVHSVRRTYLHRLRERLLG